MQSHAALQTGSGGEHRADTSHRAAVQKSSDDVSQDCTLETYHFMNQCHPNTFNCLKSRAQNHRMQGRDS